MALLPVLSICTGGAGLERGLELAGLDVRPTLYVEREAFAAAYLVAQMEQGRLARAPVWSDLESLPAGMLRELVPLGIGIVGGFPCQPWSAAGKRDGIADERWIWPAIDRLFRLARPDWCFLENVPGLVHGGLESVLRTLAESGLDAEWACVRASDAGAPHRRERLFIFAVDNSSDIGGRLRRAAIEGGNRAHYGVSREAGAGLADATRDGQPRLGLPVQRRGSRRPVSDADGRGAVVADAERDGGRERAERAEHQHETPKRGFSVAGDCSAVGNTGSPRLQGRRATAPERWPSSDDGRGAVEHTKGARRGETHERMGSRVQPFPPGPRGDWSGVPRYLWPALTREEERSIMGHAKGGEQRDGCRTAEAVPGWRENIEAGAGAAGDGINFSVSDEAASELAVRGLAHGLDGCRVDLLRLLGNGVVPQQAALAFRELASRAVSHAGYAATVGDAAESIDGEIEEIESAEGSK